MGQSEAQSQAEKTDQDRQIVEIDRRIAELDSRNYDRPDECCCLSHPGGAART